MNLPEKFMLRMKELLKDEYDDFLASYDIKRAQGIRINTLKIDIEKFKEICPFELGDNVPWEVLGFYINEEKPGKYPHHAAGLYYVQEPSAMSAAVNLEIKKGDRVLDLCAAPGGKSTQAAAYLQGEGILVSNEIETKRARILSENIERMGIRNAVVTNNSPKELEKFFPSYFDKIIVDAPCSGEGMFKKEESAIIEWSIENVRGCASRQEDIMESASKMLKPGGFLIYSTCTFSLEENEKLIDDFLKKHSDFEIENIEKKYGFSKGFGDKIGNSLLNNSARLFPHRVKGEGHFLALLRKKDGEFVKLKEVSSNIKKENIKDYLDFSRENLNISFEDKLFLVGENLFNLPSELCEIKGLRVLRSGIHLGTLKKNRFEPNHALAVSLNSGDVKRSINLKYGDEKLISYLKGNTIDCSLDDGWSLVCVDGYSLGWGKMSRGILKNHYPKGLRW